MEEKFYSGKRFLIPAKCPQCGGLFGSAEKGRLKCEYCGSEFLIPELLNAAAANVKNYYEIAYTAQESGNFKEAYDYFNKILENSPEEYLAWFGKATAAGYLSSSENIRAPEVIACLDKASQYAPEEERRETEKALGTAAGKIAADVFVWLKQNSLASNDNLSQCLKLFRYWESKVPENFDCWKWIVTLSETGVRWYTGTGSYTYSYPFRNVASEYSEKIRVKFDGKFLNKWERKEKGRSKLTITILVVVGILIGAIFLCCIFGGIIGTIGS